MADRNLALQLLITARDQASEVIGRVRASLSDIANGVSESLAPLRSFSGLMAAVIGVGGAKEILGLGDAYTRLTNSLKVAADSEAAFKKSLDDVESIASRTNSGLESTGELYSKIGTNAKAMNLEQSKVVDLTTAINQGMQLGGSSAQAQEAAITQLTQAFGSGVLRGEEFNSVMEASPPLMNQLAIGLGVTIGELRKMAEQGALTSTVVSRALLAQKDAIANAYAKNTQTVEQALTNLHNKVILFVGGLADSTGASAATSQALKFLADNMNVVAAALGGSLAAALAKSTVALSGYIQQSIAARAAARDQAIAAEAQRQAAIATAEGHLAAAQASVNRAIAEQRLANEITRLLEMELGVSATEADIAAARARSATAAQAATAATQRYATAQAELSGLQATGAASTGIFARAMGFLAGPGGLILLAVSAFAALLPMLSKNKTGIDELAQSSDQYRQSLDKLNAEQLRAKELDLDKAIKEQTKAVNDAKGKVDDLANSHATLRGVFRDSRPVAHQLTEAHGKLADEEQKLARLQENLKNTNDALVSSQIKQNDQEGRQLTQAIQRGIAIQSLSTTVGELSKRQKELSENEQERIQNEIKLAELSGNYQRVEELTLQLFAERNRQAQQQAATDHASAVAAEARVAAMQDEYQFYKELSPVQQKALADAQADATIKTKQAEASQSYVHQLQAQQAAQSGTLIAEQKSLELSSKVAAANTQNAESARSVAQAELDLAKAKGNGVAFAEAAINVTEKEIAALQAKRTEQQKEMESYRLVADRIADLTSRQVSLNAEERAELAALNQKYPAITQVVDAKQKDITATEKQIEQQKIQQAAFPAALLAKQKDLELAAEGAAANTKNAESVRSVAQAELDLAKTKGNANVIAEATLKVAKEELAILKAKQEEQQIELQKIQLIANQIADLTRRKATLNAEESAALDLLLKQYPEIGKVVNAKQKDITTTEKQIEQKELERQQAERMAGPVGQLTRLYEQKTAATQRETDAVERSYDSKIRDLNVEKDQAEAKGDAVKVAELTIKIKQEEAAQAQAVADAKGVELQAEIDLLEAKKLAIPFDEQQTAAGQEKIAAIDAQIAKLRDLKDAEQDKADSAKAAAEQEVEAAKKVEEAKKAEAEAAIAAERETRRTAEAVTTLAQSFDRMSDAGKKAWDTFKQANPGNFMADAIGAAEHVNKLVQSFDALLAAEIKAAQQVDVLADTYERGGQAGADALRQILAMGENGTDAIGHLTEAGEAARQKIEDIRQEALDAEAALNAMAEGFTREMAQLRGDQKTVLDMEHQDRLKQLEEAHQRAGQLGDEEYRTALARADELHRMKLAQLEQEQAAKEQAAAKDRGADVKAATDSYRTLGDELERVNRHVGTLATTDLSPVINQVGSLRSNLADLRASPIELNIKSSSTGGLTVEQLINELKIAKRSAL